MPVIRMFEIDGRDLRDFEREMFDERFTDPGSSRRVGAVAIIAE
jgi:hypothetical protein